MHLITLTFMMSLLGKASSLRCCTPTRRGVAPSCSRGQQNVKGGLSAWRWVASKAACPESCAVMQLRWVASKAACPESCAVMQLFSAEQHHMLRSSSCAG
jgi:hypothetical protein